MSVANSNPVKAYEKIALLFDQLHTKGNNHLEQELKSLQALLIEREINLSSSVVGDIGGGTGRIAFPLSLLAKKVILIEPSPHMLDIARSKLNSVEHGEIEFRQEGFLELSLPKESIDIVVSFGDPFQYLLKLEEQIKALENIKWSLKPGGLVLLDMMNFFSIIKRYRYPEPQFWKTKTHKYSRFVSHELFSFQGIWKHTENIYIENIADGTIEQIESKHFLKNVSSTELILLFQAVGLDKITLYPGSDLSADEGTRFWAVAQKLNVNG